MKKINPKVYTSSAFVVGFLLTDELTSAEQNALGNWLMLIAQVLCTNAYFKNLDSINNLNVGSDSDLSIESLEKMVNRLRDEIANLKDEK